MINTIPNNGGNSIWRKNRSHTHKSLCFFCGARLLLGHLVIEELINLLADSEKKIPLHHENWRANHYMPLRHIFCKSTCFSCCLKYVRWFMIGFVSSPNIFFRSKNKSMLRQVSPQRFAGRTRSSPWYIGFCGPIDSHFQERLVENRYSILFYIF